MDPRESDEKLIDYLYGELDFAEQAEFQAQLKATPVLQAEAESLRRVGQVYRSRLPEVSVPPALVRRVLTVVSPPQKKRAAFFSFNMFWRPALMGAFVMVLTLGLLYQYKQWRDRPLELAKNVPIAAHSPEQNPNRGGALSLRDLEAAATVPQPFAAPTWRSSPSLGNGLISLASYGNTAPVYEGAPSDEIYRLEEEAQFSVAQFLHQQALRMHQLGDHQGAAEAIANLIKKYPNYPRIFEALALRIGCLFQIGQIDKANQELAWLRLHSPELAQLVEQRWRR